MAVAIMVPQTAAGTGITAPNNALVDDAASAIIPAGVSNFLRLTNLTNRTLAGTRDIVGFEIQVDALAESPTGQMGMAARIYQGNVSQMVGLAPDSHDGSLVTFYGDATAQGTTTSYTVIHDLGSAQLVGHIKTKYMFGNFVGTPCTIEYSNNGTTWLPIFRGAVAFPAPGIDTTEEFDITPASARYWRATSSDPDQVKLHNFRLYASLGGAEILPSGGGGNQRVEVAITKDGTTAAGTWQAVNVTSTVSTTIIGGPTNLLGATVSQAELAASTFGILTRRADGLGGENTTTWRGVEFEQLSVYYNPSGGSFMPDRVSEVQLCILGKEASKGTVSPSINRKLKVSPVTFQSMPETLVMKFQGDRGDGDHVHIFDQSEGTMEGHPTFDELGVHLASVIGIPATTTLAAGVYRHEFILNTQALSNCQSYSFEEGDPNVAERVKYAVMTALNLKVERKSNSLGGRYIAQAMEDRTAITAGGNEVQTLTMGTATAFKLRVGGFPTTVLTTAGLASSAIQTALQALTSVGAGGLLVSGTGPFVITAGAGLAGKPIPLIEVIDEVGGTKPVMVRTTPGGYLEYDIEPIAPGMWSVYWNSTYATLGTTKLTRLFNFDWNVENTQAPFTVVDAANNSWVAAAEAPMRVLAKFQVAADQASQVMVSDCKNRVQGFTRLQAVGPVISGGFSHSLTIDLSTKIESYGEKRNVDGVVVARSFSFYSRYEPTWGANAKFVLVNKVPSY